MHKSTSVHIATPYCDNVTKVGRDAAEHRKEMLLNKRMYGNEKSGSKAAFFVHSQGFEPWTH